MRSLTCLSVVLLFVAMPELAKPNSSIPESPPVMMQAFTSTPLAAITTPAAVTNARPPLTPPPLAMKLLVVDGETTEIGYQAITSFLAEIGVPYDTVVLSSITPDASGNRLNGLALSNPSGQGNYQGIILTNNTFGVSSGNTSTSLLSTSDWSKLDTYAVQFNVRMVSYFTWPEARWGLVAMDSGATYTPANEIQASLTPTGASVFPYLNSANPIPVAGNTASGIWAYMATTTAATGETTTPLLTAGSFTIAALHTTTAGEETLALTFDNYPTLLHSLAFNYGIINWVTNGVFLGSRKIYLSTQIDLLLVGDRLYAPTLPQCPNADTCPTVRTTATDLEAMTNWYSSLHQTAAFQSYFDTFAYVGIGTTSEYSPPGDPLLTAVTALASQFGFVSHTYTHSNLDCYTTTSAGACVPATLAQSLYEIQQNLVVAATLGITVDTTGIVTPYNGGLSNANFLEAAVEEGIQSVIYPVLTLATAPSPNSGYVDATNPSIYEVPRLYTNLFDDVDSPTPGAYGSWPDEYNAYYGPLGTTPTFTENQSYSQIVDSESDNVLLLNLLTDSLFPLGFHICDVVAYDGTHSLFSDLMGAAMAKYNALFTLPVTTLKMSEMTPLLQARVSYNASGVTGIYSPGVSVVLTAVNAATIPITGACSQATCPTYGGQMQDSVSMTANSSVTLYLNAGSGVTLASLSLNPATVSGGTSSTGTVTLSGPAPSGGVVVGLASNSTSASVPGTVTVSAGSLTATFPVATTAVTSSTTDTITANYAGATQTAALTINPAVALSSVSLNPIAVTGGTPSTATVTLTGPAPSGGITVALSSNSSSATVPANVVVSAGSSTATFPVTTTAVSASTKATITASFNGISETASLTLNPAAALSSLTLNPTTVTGGTPSTATVTLTGPAPSGGITVALSSNSSSATVPANVSVAAGSSTATFTVTTKPVTSSTNASITATYNGTGKTSTLTVAPALELSSLSLNPSSVTAGAHSTGTVTLSGPAPTGGAEVTLSSSAPVIASVPASITIPAGSTSGTFTVFTRPFFFWSFSWDVAVTASYNGTNESAVLAVVQ